MEIFRIFFDGIEIKDTPKIEGFKEVIDRDFDIRGIVLKYPNSLTFVGDGYSYLLTKFRQEGFCSKVDIELQTIKVSNANDVIKGVIFLSDIIWDWDKTQCEATVEDDSWSARLINNLDISVNVKSTFTKNGEELTPAPTRTVSTYDPTDTTGVFVSTCVGFDIRDVFRVLIEFLSDNYISFESEFLEDADDIVLTTGLSLRTASEDQVVISLREVLTNLSKIYNLWFDLIDNGDGTYTFKLEDEEFFYSQSVESFTYVKGITQSTFVDRLYGSVSVGSDGEKSLGAGPGTLDFYVLETHLQEQFYIFGECNVDEELNLVNSFVYDTNAIEDVVVNSNNDYDTRFFLVEYNSTSNRANKYKYGTDTVAANPPYYYNSNFLNKNVLGRYSFQNSLLQTFGDQDNGFEAQLSANSASLVVSTNVSPMVFDQEISDPNANYNPANGRYTAPNNGTYTFEVGIFASIISKIDPDDELQISLVWVQRQGGGTVFKSTNSETFSISGENALINAPYLASFNFVAYMVAATTIEVRVNFAIVKNQPSSTFTYVYHAGSYFKTLAVFDGGGTFYVNDPANYRAALLNCELAIPDDRWGVIKANKSKLFAIDRDGRNVMNGWIRSMERDFQTGITTSEFITNLNQIVRVGS